MYAVALRLLTVVAWTSAGYAITADQPDELLLGWRGETFNGPGNETKVLQREHRQPWVETLAWKPRAFLSHGFLSPAECEHMKQLARARLARSLVVSENGSELVDPVRTSFSASIRVAEDEVVSGIEGRIARWTHLPAEHGEPMEVLRYQNNQKYDAHWDWFGDEPGSAGSGDRIATVLIYLSDVEEEAGGETALPLAEPLDAVAQSTQGMSACASRMGISVRPHLGDALLFWDALPDARVPDRLALHASCPTSRGEKWTATKWIHSLPYT